MCNVTPAYCWYLKYSIIGWFVFLVSLRSTLYFLFIQARTRKLNSSRLGFTISGSSTMADHRAESLSAKSKVGSISKMFFEYATWCLLNVMNIFNTNHERKTVKMTFVYFGCLSYKISSFVCNGCLKDVQRDFVSTRNTVDMRFHHHNR